MNQDQFDLRRIAQVLSLSANVSVAEVVGREVKVDD